MQNNDSSNYNSQSNVIQKKLPDALVISTKFKSEIEDDTFKEDLLFKKLQKQDLTIDEHNSQNIKLNVQLKNLTIKLESMQQIKD